MFTKKCDDSTLAIKRQPLDRKTTTSHLHSRDTTPSVLKPIENCSLVKDSLGFSKSKVLGITAVSLNSLTKELEAKKCGSGQLKELREEATDPDNCLE
ncbi:unnamed protein product [Sphagnum jensenii]